MGTGGALRLDTEAMVQRRTGETLNVAMRQTILAEHPKTDLGGGTLNVDMIFGRTGPVQLKFRVDARIVNKPEIFF
jgi:hypothetical protein